MFEEKKMSSPINTLAQISTTIGVAIAIIGLIGIWMSLRKQQDALDQRLEITNMQLDWSRREFAMKLLKEWVEIGRPYVEKIKKYRSKTITATGTNPIGANESEKIFQAEPGSEKWNLREGIIQLLNFFEYISVAVTYDVADQEMIEKSLGGAIKSWHTILENFIKVGKESHVKHFDPWEPFVFFALEIKKGEVSRPVRKSLGYRYCNKIKTQS